METELIQSINKLEITMSSLSSRMIDFKSSVEKRLDALGSRQMECQVNPGSCANARRLEEHIRNDKGRSGRITGIMGCVISCITVAFLIMEKCHV